MGDRTSNDDEIVEATEEGAVITFTELPACIGCERFLVSNVASKSCPNAGCDRKWHLHCLWLYLQRSRDNACTCPSCYMQMKPLGEQSPFWCEVDAEHDYNKKHGIQSKLD